MGAFVCTVGLTRRLVEADDATEALERFLAIVPRGKVLAGSRDDVTVTEADESDVADFAVGLRRRGFNVETMTLPIDLPPARARRRVRSDEHS